MVTYFWNKDLSLYARSCLAGEFSWKKDGLTNVVIHENLDLIFFLLSYTDFHWRIAEDYRVMCCFVSIFVKLIQNSPKPEKNFVGDI